MDASIAEFPEMTVANELMADREALEYQWNRDGYLYFQDVLDPDGVAEARRKFLETLSTLGLVAAGDTRGHWTGRPPEGQIAATGKLNLLHRSRVWKDFIAASGTQKFFSRLLGDPIYWLEATEYRSVVPQSQPKPDPLGGRHQDGFYNDGLEFVTCWVPLSEIPAEVGGLAVASGQHHGSGYMHDLSKPPRCAIPAGSVPAESWRRAAVYRPGDVVVFHQKTPHTGLPNYSNVVRLSMDLRPQPATAARAIAGSVVGRDDHSITVRQQSGDMVRLKVDQRTYLRLTQGARIPVSHLTTEFRLGEPVIAARDGELATLVRSPSYLQEP